MRWRVRSSSSCSKISLGMTFLTERNFGTLYKSTPLRPLQRNSGHPDRWRACFQANGTSFSFARAHLWKTYMHFILVQQIRLPAEG